MNLNQVLENVKCSKYYFKLIQCNLSNFCLKLLQVTNFSACSLQSCQTSNPLSPPPEFFVFFREFFYELIINKNIHENILKMYSVSILVNFCFIQILNFEPRKLSKFDFDQFSKSTNLNFG